MTRGRQTSGAWRVAAFGVGLCALLWCSSLLAKQGIVRTRDGRTIEGDVTEKADQVLVKAKGGIQTTINRDNVAGIDYFENVEQQYEAKRKALPKNPTAGDHLALARWLLDNRAYELSLREIEAARKVDPNSAEAVTLEQTVMAQRRLERPRGEAPGTGAAPPAPRPPANAGAGAGTGAAAPPKAGDGKLLTPDDIAMIRKWEWKETDNSVPRVTVPPDVRRRYVTLRSLHPGDFAALTGPQQAWTILQDQDAPAELKREIRVTSDPQALMEFRRTIQPLVVNNCATAGCHGGNQAGHFMLHHNNTEREDVAYTNFYTLRASFNKLGDKRHYMLDPAYPNESILAQYALHPDFATLDHPELKGQTYKAMAPSPDAPAYVAITDWMRTLSLDVVPDDPKKPVYWIQANVPGVMRPAAGAPPAGGGGAAPGGGAPAGGGNPPAGGGATPPAGGQRPPANK